MEYNLSSTLQQPIRADAKGERFRMLTLLPWAGLRYGFIRHATPSTVVSFTMKRKRSLTVSIRGEHREAKCWDADFCPTHFIEGWCED